jgi:hypothetical protein
MKKRMAVWVVVLPLLVVFSTSLVGTALAAHSTTENKAGVLIPAHPETGKLVLLQSGDRFSLFKEYFGLRPSTSVCWVSTATLASLETRYDTSVSTISVRDRGSFDLVTVNGANPGHIRQILGQHHCVLVGSHHAFFLPLDGHTS